MFNSTANPARAYARIGIETAIDSASPHKLILMLFDGALLALSCASGLMQEKRTAEKGQAISRAIDIIVNGLKLSLVNTGTDNVLRERLEALYDYMTTRLIYANRHNDAAALKEVSFLLGELSSAWEAIADDPAVLARQKIAA